MLWYGPVVGPLVKTVLRRRMNRLHWLRHAPLQLQDEVFAQIRQQALGTRWGTEHGITAALAPTDYARTVPIRSYEETFPYIELAMQGQPGVLTPGVVQWFAKSSGTTNAVSKYIPVPAASLHGAHYEGGKDLMAAYLLSRPGSRLFSGRALSVGGSHQITASGTARSGDLSAVLIQNMPLAYELFRCPSRPVALMDSWDTKLEAMAQETMRSPVSSLAGVPTWTLMLLRRILELNPGRTLPQIWPQLEVFFHGAVAFTPYRAEFERLLPHPGMQYREVYNASEGFFALQDDPTTSAMLLAASHGTYYELLPLDQLDQPWPETVPLAQAEVGRLYALVISTTGGLYRYLLGDTVRFASVEPYRLHIVGRTRSFINAFGEELMVAQADAGISAAAQATGAVVADYTAGPVYFSEGRRGGHEWLIEFAAPPNDMAAFTQVLDATLRRLNSDYDAKRSHDLALAPPLVHAVAPGTFSQWLRSQGKLGGQHKVPRLKNDRSVLEQLLPVPAGRL